MKKLLLLCCFGLFISCHQSMEVTTTNINTIFATKDFSINFIPVNGSDITMSFREDYMTFKKGGEVKRVNVSYEDIAHINAFVQQQYNKHDPKRGERPSVIIYDDTRKIKMRVPRYGKELDALLKTLPL